MGRPQFSRRTEGQQERAGAAGNTRLKDYSFTTASGGTDSVYIITKGDEPDDIKFAQEVVTGIFMSEVAVDPQKLRMQIYCEDKNGNRLWEVRHHGQTLNLDPPLQLPPESELRVLCTNNAASACDLELNVVVAEVES